MQLGLESHKEEGFQAQFRSEKTKRRFYFLKLGQEVYLAGLPGEDGFEGCRGLRHGKLMGLNPSTLRSRMGKLGISYGRKKRKAEYLPARVQPR